MSVDLLEDQVVLFVDLLGFSESTSKLNPELATRVLKFLTGVASLRSEFLATNTKQDNGTTHNVRPSISTFSDHIVASYSLSKINADEGSKPFIVMANLSGLVAAIALSALAIGFLTRGGVSMGKLYHTGGVVFGEALIDAVALESRTAVYPRIILSKEAELFFGSKNGPWTARDFDGIRYIDYYRDCLLRAAPPGNSYLENTGQWFALLIDVLTTNLLQLDEPKYINQRAKWAYFCRKLHETASALSPEILKDLHIDPALIPDRF